MEGRQPSTKDISLENLKDHSPKAPECSYESSESAGNESSDNKEDSTPELQPAPGEDRIVTRSGREVRKPIRFQAGSADLGLG